MDRIVVLGGGGHAKVVISILRKSMKWEIIGYTDNSDRGTILGARYLGDDEALPEIVQRDEGCSAVIGVGSVKSSVTRARLRDKLQSLGFELPHIISPGCVVNEGVTIGKGTVLFDGAVVNTGATIGECCIINSNSTVEHDARIGNFVHIAPGATVCGGTTIGNGTLIGAAAAVIEGVTIVENCLIGAGATVIDDCAVPGTYVGTPARRIKCEEQILRS